MNRACFFALATALLPAVCNPSIGIAADAPGEEELQRVTTRLKQSNPGFSGPKDHKSDKGRVTELCLYGNELHDLAPLRGMTLTYLDCSASQVESLEPLRGMRLETLHCYYTKVSDLAPLKGMPLNKLWMTHTPVSDLSPLKAMPLTWLTLKETNVSSLEPLRRMPLKFLNCQDTKISDLSAVQTMPLEEIWCDLRTDLDKEILAAVPTLKKINGRSRSDALGPIAEAAKRTATEEPKKTGAGVRRSDPEAPRSARKFGRSQSSIKGLYVVTTGLGQRMGSAQDIIATVEAGSSNKGTSCDILGDVAKDTKISMQEAERLLRLRHPAWPPGHRVRFSYGDKYTKQAGGSAGGAFSVLLQSLLEGFQIDPGFAMTGDVTVDGKIRVVGAVAEKIRGATLERCSVVAIPLANRESLNDMAILYSPSMLWSIQILSISTLDDAAAVARLDRTPNLANALSLFYQVQRGLGPNAPAGYLRNQETYQALQQVLQLAPNHLSAEFMLRMASNQLPVTLSLSSSMEEIWAASTLMRGYLLDDKTPDPKKNTRYHIERLPAEAIKTALDRLLWLDTRLHPKTRDFKNAMYDFIQSLDYLRRQSGADVTTYTGYLGKRDKVVDELVKLGMDRKALEELMH